MAMSSKLKYVMVVALLLMLGIAYLIYQREKEMSQHHFSKELDHQLEQAVLANDVAGIESAIKSGANVNARGKHNITHIMLAVDRLYMNAVKTLLAYKANPNLKTDDGYSAVSLAVDNYSKMPEMMEVIFSGGGDPNMRGPNDKPVIEHFLTYRNCDVIRYMHRIGADIDIKVTSKSKRPIIVDASGAGDWDVVWCLLELGAKFDYKDTDGSEALSTDVNFYEVHSGSPLFPYKKKVWLFLKEHGAKELKPLFDDSDHLGAETK